MPVSTLSMRGHEKGAQAAVREPRHRFEDHVPRASTAFSERLAPPLIHGAWRRRESRL